MVYKAETGRDIGGSGDDPLEEWHIQSSCCTRSQEQGIINEPWWSRSTEEGSHGIKESRQGSERTTKKRKRRRKMRKRRQIQAPIHQTRTALLRSMYIRRWIEEESAQPWYENRRALLQRTIRRMRSCAGRFQQHQRRLRSASDDDDNPPEFLLKLPVGLETDVSAIREKVFPLIMAKLKENNYPEKEKTKIALEVLRRLQFPIEAPKVVPKVAPVVDAPKPAPAPVQLDPPKEQEPAVEQELPKYGIRRSLQNLKKKTDIDLPKRATSTSRTTSTTKLQKNKSLEVATGTSSKHPHPAETSSSVPPRRRKSIGCQTLITSTQMDVMLRRGRAF